VYMAVKSIPERQVEVATAHALVAARTLPVGTLLTPDDVKLVPWPAANQVPGAFTDVGHVANRGVVVTIAENEPITDAKLAPVGTGAGLPPTIPEGMRAISVRVNEIVGVAGFVIPGAYVDVLVSININTGSGDSVTRVVLSNVRVLTAGTRYDQERAQQDGKPIPTSVVTLLVTPDDAEKVALAQDEGRLMLTLRNPLDQLPTQTTGVRRASLVGGPNPPPVERVVQGRTVVRAAPRPEPPPPTRPYTVETIRAAKRAEEEVR
jgi:pilus assembly protein CpaB